MRTLGVLVLVAGLSQSLTSQMLNPSIDREDEPFCYFSKPTDEIGVMDGRQATLVSPEGFLYTGSGELMFFTGNPPTPINQRVKTLLKGYLPVVQYKFVRDDIEYSFSTFAATLDGNPEDALMNFVRIEVKNLSTNQRTAYCGAGIRYQGEANTTWGVADNRFGRPAKAKIVGNFEQAGVEFSRDWIYSFDKDALLRDSAIVYVFPTDPDPVRLMTLKTGYNEQQEVRASKLYVTPTTPVGIVNYALLLKPGEHRILDFKMPYISIPAGSADIDKLRKATYDDYLAKTVSFWETIVKNGVDITVPEDKVVNTFKASLVYDLIGRNKIDSFYVQKVNDFQYHSFWLRDASFIVRMYDLSGYHEIARQCLEFFGRWQQNDGNFVSQGGQYDGWGQTLWAYGQHYRITHDKQFAEAVYPSILRAFEWLRNARKSDPLRLVPVTSPGDNEDITGHVTGHNFWALVGLINAKAIAVGLGKNADATQFQREYDDLRESLMKQLKRITKVTKGYIPPGVENNGGQDWDNMSTLYPEILFDTDDRMVTATLDSTRAKYQEGLMTYGDGRWLHHYLTITNTESEVVRGSQQAAIEDLYALLVHTSATQAGFEYSILPWSTRDFMMNLSPHGWFAAQYRALVRNMLVREQGRELHLLSCLSPEWIKDGKSVSVHNAPTYFGTVSYDMVFSSGQTTLDIDAKWFDSPEKIILHLPWFMDVSSAISDGKTVRIRNATLALEAGTRTVVLHWSTRPDRVQLNYGTAVENYKKEYARRYKEFLETGKQVY
ncbi:MAG TPA: hypothetical protein VI758_14325 [Bacteroidota bacterium]